MGLRSAVEIVRPRVRGLVSLADLVTLTNLLCGFFAIITLSGDPGGEVFSRYPDHLWVIILIVLGGVADALDGMVARRFGSSALGADLDTLADAVTFVIAPALLLVFIYGTPDEMPLRATLVAGLVVVMGILRLARFNTAHEGEDSLTFEGFPTPVIAGAICALVLIEAPAVYALSVTAVLAMLMMSNISYPKNRYSQRLAIATIAASLFIVGGIVFMPQQLDFFAKGGFVLGALVVAIFPFLLHRKQRSEAAKESADEQDLDTPEETTPEAAT